MTDPVCPLTARRMRFWMHVNRDWRRPGAQGGWDLWWSDAGDMGQIHPRPAPADVAAFYDLEHYYTHDTFDRTGPRVTGWLSRLMVALTWRLDRGVLPDRAWWERLVPGGAALEIGCGHGNLMGVYAPMMDSAVGVEPDASARAVATANGLTVYPGTAEDLPGEVLAGRYDLIVISHVLEHCIDPVAALQNAAALLNPGGVMMVETPNSRAIAQDLKGKHWHWLDVPRHLNFFTQTSLRTLVTRAGLQVERAEYWGYVRQFAPDWIETEARIDARLRGESLQRAHVLRQERASLWLMLRTIFASPARKYDSVRLICRK
jgi:2-polyprenyl-3-methyl-5-hydroxy-6-metoxy-1,4-benzoquinol methylase